MSEVKIGDILYYAQCLKEVGVFNVLEIKIRTTKDNWLVGIEKRTKQSYLFYQHEIGNKYFSNRDDALKMATEMEDEYRNERRGKSDPLNEIENELYNKLDS